MGPIEIAGLVLLGILVVTLFWAVASYNNLVTLRNRFKNAFAQIDVQLKRRYDLIPNLVETAKAYMTHEREALEAVIAARNQAQASEQRAAAAPGDARAMQGLAGGLPGPQGQPDHDAVERGTHLHREPGRLRPPGLQRCGDLLQHLLRALPLLDHCRNLRLPAGEPSRNPGCRARGAAGLLLLTGNHR